MKLLTAATKQSFYSTFLYATILSMFFGYIIGAAAVVIMSVTSGFFQIAGGVSQKYLLPEIVGVIAGAVTSVAVSVIVSYVWGLILGT